MKKVLKKQVEKMLKECEKCRCSDIHLTLHLWYEDYPNMVHDKGTPDSYVYLRDIKDLPREDNVKRVRAKFQNEENLYLPADPKVRLKRGIEEVKWRKFLEYN